MGSTSGFKSPGTFPVARDSNCSFASIARRLVFRRSSIAALRTRCIAHPLKVRTMRAGNTVGLDRSTDWTVLPHSRRGQCEPEHSGVAAAVQRGNALLHPPVSAAVSPILSTCMTGRFTVFVSLSAAIPAMIVGHVSVLPFPATGEVTSLYTTQVRFRHTSAEFLPSRPRSPLH